MKLRVLLPFFLVLLPLSLLASLQIAGSKARSPGQQADYIVVDTPGALRVNPAFTLFPAQGSLYATVKSYTKKHGWRLKWSESKSYKIVHTYMIAGPSLQSVMNNLLSHYPGLRARYNKHHKIMSVGLRAKR